MPIAVGTPTEKVVFLHAEQVNGDHWNRPFHGCAKSFAYLSRREKSLSVL